MSTGESAENAARGREFEHAEIDVVEPRTVTKASDRLEEPKRNQFLVGMSADAVAAELA